VGGRKESEEILGEVICLPFTFCIMDEALLMRNCLLVNCAKIYLICMCVVINSCTPEIVIVRVNIAGAFEG
jgi:hypothetical protein